MGQFQRIMIIGGAGKTTLSRKSAFLSRLPLRHIDPMYWNTVWTPRDYDDIVLLSSVAAQGETWVIEGNYEPTMALRAERADLIIFLDVSRSLRTVRVFLRFLKFWGRRRPEMPYGCTERFDFQHLREWVWKYDQHSRPAELRRLMADPAFLTRLMG